MTFRIIEQDKTVVSTIQYKCFCIEDAKACLITESQKLEMIANGHKFF